MKHLNIIFSVATTILTTGLGISISSPVYARPYCESISMVQAPVGTTCIRVMHVDTGKTKRLVELSYPIKSPPGWIIKDYKFINVSNQGGNGSFAEVNIAGEQSAAYSRVLDSGRQLEEKAAQYKASGQYKGVGAAGSASSYEKALSELDQARNFVTLYTGNTSFVRAVIRANGISCGFMDRCGGWYNADFVVTMEKLAPDPNMLNSKILQAIRDIEVAINNANAANTPSTLPPQNNTQFLTRIQLRDGLINELVNRGYTAQQVTPLCNCVAKDIFERYTSEQLTQLSKNQSQLQAVMTPIVKDCETFYPIGNLNPVNNSNSTNPNSQSNQTQNTEPACLIKIGNTCVLPLK